MKEALIIGAVQMNSRDDKKANLERAVSLIAEGVEQGAELVALPENFNFLGPQEQEGENAEPIPGPTIRVLADEAQRHGIFILAGSILEGTEGTEKVYNTSVLLDPQGNEVARYRKMHLFDIEILGQLQATESATMLGGCELVTAETVFGTFGFSICYDLRFPELYRSLALLGARVIFTPAAFRLYTGKDHWEVLLRARAIENGVFMVAPAQIGARPPDVQSFGNAMIIDPWGTVVARAAEREMTVVATLDFSWQDKVRSAIPCLKQRRPNVYQL